MISLTFGIVYMLVLISYYVMRMHVDSRRIANSLAIIAAALDRAYPESDLVDKDL